MDESFEKLLARVERVATEPGSVKAGWVRLVRPVYRMMGWQARFEGEKLTRLFGGLSRRCATNEVGPLLDAAAEELDQNITRAERACVVNGEVSVAHTAWLFRVVRVLAQTSAAHQAAEGDPARRLLHAFDPLAALPPLAVAMSVEDDVDAAEAGGPMDAPRDRRATELIGLQLAAIDHVIDAARSECDVLLRRRRLLEGARRLLLESSAALRLEASGVRGRLDIIAREIVEIDRFQAAGVRDDIGLVHQARTALSRRERQRLVAAMTALDTFALKVGDVQTLACTSPGLDRLWQGADCDVADVRLASLAQSADDQFGARTTQAIRAAMQRGLRDAKANANESGADPELLELTRTYLAPGCDAKTMAALMAVDGCFDVGATLSPVRVEELETRVRVVAHPTQDLMLTPAETAADIPNAVISDPRTILLDLATRRLLTRKFVEVEQHRHTKIRMAGEIRVYLLDGSTSMMTDGVGTARARMRDALLLAEIATCLARFENAHRYTRVALFYRYFTKKLWPLHRVDTAGNALAAMGEVASTTRTGGTDIEYALLSSFRLIRRARGRDADLSRAQIVLVTDGQSDVDQDKVLAAREKIKGMSIGVSVIALGEENDALRNLVARQRARGERAFYHFMDDAALHAVAEGDFASRALHLPAEASSEDLQDTVGDLVSELAEVSRERAAPRPTEDQSGTEAEARRSLGISDAGYSEGAIAKRQAASRDRSALRARFLRWFPTPDAKVLVPTGKPNAGDPSSADEFLDAVTIALATVCEVVGEFGGRPIDREADAIDLLERLLPDARLSPARYQVVLEAHPVQVAPYLSSIHRSVGLQPEGQL